MLEPRHARIREILAAHEVRFVVIGGVGLQMHGRAHATLDLDVAVADDELNQRRLDRALLQLRARQVATGHLGTAFETRYGRLDVLTRTDGLGDYHRWADRAQPRTVGPVTVLLAAERDILRSKQAAGRAKDLAVRSGIELADADQELSAAALQLLGHPPSDPTGRKRWNAIAAVADLHQERFAIQDATHYWRSSPTRRPIAAERRCSCAPSLTASTTPDTTAAAEDDQRPAPPDGGGWPRQSTRVRFVRALSGPFAPDESPAGGVVTPLRHCSPASYAAPSSPQPTNPVPIRIESRAGRRPDTPQPVTPKRQP